MVLMVTQYTFGQNLWHYYKAEDYGNQPYPAMPEVPEIT